MTRLARARLLLGAAVSAAIAGSVAAFPGPIDIFADASGSSCMIEDRQPGLITMYVVQWAASGATAVQFRVEAGAGFTGIYASATLPPGFLSLGEPPNDYQVAYTSCLTGKFLVCTLTYLGSGTSATCSHVAIGPAPSSPLPGEIVIANCQGLPEVAFQSGPAVVNYQDPCQAWCILATESSTWGKIKALYR